MEEPPPNRRGRRPAQAPSAAHLRPVPGFPGWTHLLAAIAFPVWSIGTDAYYYGIETGYDWWQGFDGLGPALVVVVLIAVLPPAVAVEAWAVLHGRHRWVARVTVLCYVLVAGFITFIPTGLRFFGDTSPTPVDLVTLSLTSYGIVVGAQAVLAYVVCRLWLSRRKRLVRRPGTQLTPP